MTKTRVNRQEVALVLAALISLPFAPFLGMAVVIAAVVLARGARPALRWTVVAAWVVVLVVMALGAAWPDNHDHEYKQISSSAPIQPGGWTS